MSDKDEKSLRDYLQRLPTWNEAHADLKAAVSNIPRKCRGRRPQGVPHSSWELLEHMRLAAWDILEFTRNPKHKSPPWPSGYWPSRPQPPSDAAWGKSVKELQKALKAMGDFVANPKTNLFTPIPHGSGQTVLRQALLLADHNAYHVGQLVLVRRLLGWRLILKPYFSCARSLPKARDNKRHEPGTRNRRFDCFKAER